MNQGALARRGSNVLQRVPGDLQYVEDVVRISYPIHSARAYLRRRMGNEVRFKLVEAQRGEKVGHVRAAEVIPSGGGEHMLVRGQRVMPDGSPATFYTPDDLVVLRTELSMPAGHQPFALTNNDIVLLHVPVRGYTRYLPAIYTGGGSTTRRDVVKADEMSQRRWGAREEVAKAEPSEQAGEAFRRFLFIFQHMMTTVVQKVEQIPALTDPIAADPHFLPWIASWVNFEFDHSLPLHEQRELVRRAIRIYRMRGTVEGMEEIVRVLTSAPVKLLECSKPPPAVLGGATLAGAPRLPERYLGAEPPAHFLYPRERPVTRYFVMLLESRSRFERRFGERATDVLRRIARVVSTERPSHVQFTIRFAEED